MGEPKHNVNNGVDCGGCTPQHTTWIAAVLVCIINNEIISRSVGNRMWVGFYYTQGFAVQPPINVIMQICWTNTTWSMFYMTFIK